MPSYSLPPLVGFGLLDEVPVFLDLRADRYFKGDPATAAALARASHVTRTRADEIALERLAVAGVLVRSDEAGTILETSPFIPRESALDGPAAKPGIADVAAAWRYVAGIRRQLRRGGLEQVVQGLVQARSKGEANPLAEEKIQEAAARFAAARRLVPLRPNCLSDSLALASWLARRSLFPDLVFGVKLHPFAAHCWLQTGDAVLNDNVDSVAAFAPVLAL